MRHLNKIVLRIYSFLVFCLIGGSVCPDLYGSEELKDVKSPVEYPSSLLFIVGVVLVVILVGAGIYYLLSRKKKALPAKPVEVKTPYEIAFERLQLLLRKGLIPAGQYLQYYQELSDIIRQYFEDQFRIRAPEMTSEEFLTTIGNSSKLNSQGKEALAQFLRNCDMVKFAKYSPRQEEAVESFELAKNLLKVTV